MNALKGLYIWTLVTLLMLAGCLGGGVIDEGEGEDAENNSGIAPIIYKNTDTSCSVDFENSSGETVMDITCDAHNIAADDPDGFIIEFGIDFDKDMIIDARFNNSFDIPLDYEEIEKLDGDFPIENLTWHANIQSPLFDCITSVYLVAEDNDYQKAIELIYLELRFYHESDVC